MATEETRLLKKPFDYLSNASLTVDPKSRECIVVVPTVYTTNNSRDNIDEFVGLTIEELYLYMDDPWWRFLRRGIFISFWILMFAIFASACIISIVEYKQQCTINSMKSSMNLINADTNAMSANSTADVIHILSTM
ncbi:uncharacterized protein LOC116338631 [Contarinia nasturtii]|uniref:uncharacterized protein LOC116338631 n=1 Tax=Contarinia nasturtii TaxID=265458 RepID=UPI0012D37B4A|nr:uncharacterized protein LOC116338631 [Contarinia nasturtii]